VASKRRVRRFALLGALGLCGCTLPNPAWGETSTVSGASVSASASISTTLATASVGSVGSVGTTTTTTTTSVSGSSTSPASATGSTSATTTTGEPTSAGETTSTGEPTGGLKGPDCAGHGDALVACYHFPIAAPEGVLVDGSSYAHQGVLTDASLVASPLGVGVENMAESVIHYGDDGKDVDEPLDFPGNHLSMLVAVRLNAFAPKDMRAAVLDKGGQYSIFIWDTGDIRCQVGDFVEKTGVLVSLGEWTHIGCVFDGRSIRVFLNGEEVENFSQVTSLSSDANNDLVLAADSPDLDARFAGAIDNVELWNVALGEDVVCARAGPLCAR